MGGRYAVEKIWKREPWYLRPVGPDGTDARHGALHGRHTPQSPASAGTPIPGDLLGTPFDDIVVIAVFLLAAVLIGASIALNIASLRARRPEDDVRP